MLIHNTHDWSVPKVTFARLGEGPKAKNVLDTSDFDFEAAKNYGFGILEKS